MSQTPRLVHFQELEVNSCVTGGGHANMLWLDAAGSGHKVEFYDVFARFLTFLSPRNYPFY